MANEETHYYVLWSEKENTYTMIKAKTWMEAGMIAIRGLGYRMLFTFIHHKTGQRINISGENLSSDDIEIETIARRMLNLIDHQVVHIQMWCGDHAQPRTECGCTFPKGYIGGI